MLNESYVNVTDKAPGVIVGEVTKLHPQLRYLKHGEIVTYAEGLDQFLSYIGTKMPTPKRDGDSAEMGRGDFHAFHTYEEAMDTFRNHPEKVVDFNPGELRIKDEHEAGSLVDYDVVGDYIDMGRFMEGVPESWGSMHLGNARNRRVNVILDGSHYWGVDHKDITHRGERILRLVDALEAGGVRTQITAIESTQTNHCEVVIKQHDEPLTIGDLAVVTHPEFLRRILFRVIEYSKTFDSGYGHAREFGNAINQYPEMLHSSNNDEVNIFIGGNMQGISLIDTNFDKLEKLLVWEMSKQVPEVDAIKLNDAGIYFNPNGQRSTNDIRREGMEAINAD